MKIQSNEVCKKPLYHGTVADFTSIDLSKAGAFKDYGKGFYLTTNFGQASCWASRELRAGSVKKAFVYEYFIDSTVIDLEVQQYFNKEWLDMLSVCRKGGEPTNMLDVIYDRMADSTSEDINRQVDKYIAAKNRGLEFRVLENVLAVLSNWNDPTYDQYCFKTERAISILKFRGRV